jgi:preprotein translocase subunit SecB
VGLRAGGRGRQVAPATAPTGEAQLKILSQYVKDLSFECPSRVKFFSSPGPNPEVHAEINVRYVQHPEEVYEVTLNLDVHVKSDFGVLYHAELDYSGLFRVQDVPKKLLELVVFVMCPTLLFPFARRLLADLTQDAGFPPLMLDPVDFAGLYATKLQRNSVGAVQGSWFELGPPRV